jgi:DNA-binding transcriptional LysR family regulator
VTLTQLRYFVAAADLGSFTAAADSLHLTQPAVAEQIRRLESALGVDLFLRLGRGVRLTAAGAAFAEQARRVLAAAEEARAAATDVKELRAGTHAFGGFGAAAAYGLADVVARFAAEHPQVRLRIVGRNSSVTADAVRSGDVEAGLVVLPVDDDGLEVRPVARDEVLYASADRAHTAAPVAAGTLLDRRVILYEAQYAKQDPTRRQLAERAQALGARLEPRVEVELADTALALAAAGIGDTYVPRVIARSATFLAALTTVPFDPPLFDTFAIVGRRGSRLSPPMRQLTARVERHMRQRLG